LEGTLVCVIKHAEGQFVLVSANDVFKCDRTVFGFFPPFGLALLAVGVGALGLGVSFSDLELLAVGVGALGFGASDLELLDLVLSGLVDFELFDPYVEYE
jgi:hypothetical protein